MPVQKYSNAIVRQFQPTLIRSELQIVWQKIKDFRLRLKTGSCVHYKHLLPHVQQSFNQLLEETILLVRNIAWLIYKYLNQEWHELAEKIQLPCDTPQNVTVANEETTFSSNLDLLTNAQNSFQSALHSYEKIAHNNQMTPMESRSNRLVLEYAARARFNLDKLMEQYEFLKSDQSQRRQWIQKVCKIKRFNEVLKRLSNEQNSPRELKQFYHKVARAQRELPKIDPKTKLKPIDLKIKSEDFIQKNLSKFARPPHTHRDTPSFVSQSLNFSNYPHLKHSSVERPKRNKIQLQINRALKVGMKLCSSRVKISIKKSM